jgi:uncharacterized RDD family membrane protein YckC
MNIVGDASKARLIAVFFDNLIALALTMLAAAVLPAYTIVRIAVLIMVYLGYFVVLEALWSRTLGKFFQGLVVRKLDGSPCDWTAALIRTALRVIEVNPVLLGGIPAGIAVISSSRKQRLGDALAGTLVVSDSLKWHGESYSWKTEIHD